jgi:hypothetical protein
MQLAHAAPGVLPDALDFSAPLQLSADGDCTGRRGDGVQLQYHHGFPRLHGRRSDKYLGRCACKEGSEAEEEGERGIGPEELTGTFDIPLE